MLHGSGLAGIFVGSVIASVPAGSRMPGRACRVASVISAKKVAWRPGLFHSTCRSKAWNRSA